MADLTAANTILAQLGGRRFLAMTGAESFASSADTLSFRLPSRLTPRRIRGVRIRLDASDTYTVTFLRMGTKPDFTPAIVAECSDVYAENLREVFTRETGLDTSL